MGGPVVDDRVRAGLCADCHWARRVPSAHGSVFFLCRRAETDRAYLRYPRLPRLSCPGYEGVVTRSENIVDAWKSSGS